MVSKSTFDRRVGIIGAGSFGKAVASILAENCDQVLLYVRSRERLEKIVSKNELKENIKPTLDLKLLAESCTVIFPMVPSGSYKPLIAELAPYLKPSHILIHGIKGFATDEHLEVTRSSSKTVSQVTLEESSVLRVGCIAGPNLASELEEGKPAATVIASEYQEVIEIGQRLLKNDRFIVFGSRDLIGVELCGILKNIIAVGAGSIYGLGLGENAKAAFISRGLVEMFYIGKLFGANVESFLGLAGVGDLIATCTSNLSRNFTVGLRLSQGEKLEAILNSMEEVAEGIKTINIVNGLTSILKVRCPITETLYKIIHEQITIDEAHKYLMLYPFQQEISIS